MVSYADLAAGHVGTIYQAAGWLYSGLSEAQPLMAIGDGPPRHTRSIASVLGTQVPPISGGRASMSASLPPSQSTAT